MISKPVLIRLFLNGLRPSIRVQAKQEGCRKNTCNQVIKKVITAEAKAALNLSLLVREIDVCCPRSYHFALKHTKDYTRERSSLPFRSHKARVMFLHRSGPIEIERPRRDHQKDMHDRNCRIHGSCVFRPQGSTPATGVNTTETLAQNDCGPDQLARREDRDLSKTTCYNCNKKPILPSNALSSGGQKTSIGLGNLLVGDWC